MFCLIYRTFFILMAGFLLMAVSFRSAAQSIERIQFSGVASGNNNFQPVAGVPYASYLPFGCGASLTVSSKYGKNVFLPLRFESSVRGGGDIDVFSNHVVYELQVRRRGGIGKPETLILLDSLGRGVGRQTLEGERPALTLRACPRAATGWLPMAGHGRS
jgi:hypothetical protein